MLKYIKHHMETISGIEIYPLISLVLFFSFFTLLFYYVMVIMDKKHIAELSDLPLEVNNKNNPIQRNNKTK